MRTRLLGLLIAAFGFLALGAGSAHAQGAADPKGPGAVTCGFYVYNIRDVDLKRQRFGADFYFWMRYGGPASKEVERMDFVNGRVEALDELERVTDDNGNYVCWKVAATFQTRISLEHYPFDSQRLELSIEHPTLELAQLRYAHDEKSYGHSTIPPDRWGIKNGLAVPDFRVVGTELRPPEPYAYETDFGRKVDERTIGSTYSRLTLAILVHRLFVPYFWKTLVPFMVILALAYLAFWVPPQELLFSGALAMTALVAAVVFHVSISQQLPETSALIVPDKFFITTLLLIFASIVHSIWTFNLARTGREVAAYKADVAARVAFPVVYLSTFGYLLAVAMRGA